MHRRYNRQIDEMRHYVDNVASPAELADRLLARRHQVLKLKRALQRAQHNERQAGARIEELKTEVERLRSRLVKIGECVGCVYNDCATYDWDDDASAQRSIARIIEEG